MWEKYFFFLAKLFVWWNKYQICITDVDIEKFVILKQLNLKTAPCPFKYYLHLCHKESQNGTGNFYEANTKSKCTHQILFHSQICEYSRHLLFSPLKHPSILANSLDISQSPWWLKCVASQTIEYPGSLTKKLSSYE